MLNSRLNPIIPLFTFVLYSLILWVYILFLINNIYIRMGYPKNKEEMIERGMVPLGQPGNEERDAKVRAKGKGVSSAKGSISATIRHIKDGHTKNVDEAVLELVRNPEMSAIQLTELANTMTDKFGDLSAKNQIALLKVLNDRYKTLFGGKLSLDADVKLTNSDAIMQRLQDWKRAGASDDVEYNVPEEVEVDTSKPSSYTETEALKQWKKDQAAGNVEEEIKEVAEE